MLQQESIYNLIPKPKIIPILEKIYESQHLSNKFPTGTTFNLKGSSYPNVANLQGDDELPPGGHSLIRSSSTFGRPIGSYKPNPLNYIKKNHQYKILPECKPLRSKSEIRKPPVPTIKDKPIMGLVSGKNYVYANALDVIMMKTKNKQTKEVDFRTLMNYGKIPKYLQLRRNLLDQERSLIIEMQNTKEHEQDKTKKEIPQAEVAIMREGLLKKMEIMKFNYGKITHKRKFDSLQSQKRKEELERQIEVMEMDISKLNSKSVILDYKM